MLDSLGVDFALPVDNVAGEMLVAFDDNFAIQQDDEIFLRGSPESIGQNLHEFPQDLRPHQEILRGTA